MPNEWQPESIAEWSPTEGRWLICGEQSGALFALSEPFSGRWPTSGMTRRGVAYPLPAWEPLTAGSASSSPQSPTALLGTPTARDGKGSGQGERLEESARRGQVEAQVVLLPTPNPFHAGNEEEPEDWRERRLDVFERTGTRHGPALGVVARSIADGDPMTPDRYMPEDKVLPTPTAGAQGKSKRAMTASRDNGRRSGGGQSSPLGLDEVVSLASGVRPEHMPDDEDLPPASRAIIDSLLPTPSAVDGLGGHESRGSDRGNERLLAGIAKDHADGRLFPTPRVAGSGDNDSERRRNSPNLESTVAMDLLPTPAAYDGERGGPQDPDKRRAGGHAVSMDANSSGGGYNGQTNVTLTDATVRGRTAWGDYAPAIARWEPIVGREVPEPTQESTRGTQQLAPTFVEWMMGLPAGHVTDTPGITRNQALKALGNGVVPQQGAAALAWLLPRLYDDDSQLAALLHRLGVV